MIKDDVAVQQGERCPVWIDEAGLKPFHPPLIVQRRVFVLQMRMVQVLIADRFDVEIDDDVPSFRNTGA